MTLYSYRAFVFKIEDGPKGIKVLARFVWECQVVQEKAWLEQTVFENLQTACEQT